MNFDARSAAGRLQQRSLLSGSYCAMAVVLASFPAITLAEEQGSSANDRDPTTLPRVRVEDEVLVEATRYSTPKTTTATKTDTALLDVPQSISVITSDLIRDQSMSSMADIARYVPGFSMGQGEGHRDAPTLRGNSTTADFFVDGVRDDVQYFRDLYNAERIEVLKGPNAMIFGRGGAGGVINRVTKAADGEHHSEFAVQAGTDDNKRVAADLGEAVNDVLALRLNAMYEDSESYRDFVEIDRYGLNPTVGLALSDQTRLWFSYEYFNDERTVDRGVPSRNGRPLDIDESTFFGNPDQSYSEATISLGSVTVEHAFSDTLQLRNRTQYGDYDKYYQNVYPNSAVNAAGNVTLDAYQSGTQRENLFNQTDLIWRVSAGSVAHTVLAGIEVGQQDTGNLRNNSTFGTTPAAVVPITNPVTFAVPVFDRPNQNNDVEVSVAAVYVQDQIELSDQFQLIAGVRFDQFDIEFDNHLSGAHFERDDDFVSPRVGLIYKPADPMSVYASYSVSYLPSSGDQFSSLDATSAALEPEEFENLEVGVKWDVLPDLALTAAVYQLDRTNTRAPGPTPGTIVLTGEQRSEGVELGVSGAITPDWELIAGYAYQDAEITRTTSAAPNGRNVALVPKHQVSLWNTYRLTPMWRVGLGVIHQDEVYASISNAVTLPSFTRVDGAVYFTLNEHFEAQLNLENLFDEDYFGTAHNDNNITPGSPTAARVMLTTRF
jgi:catecholate siderophore receptor